MAASDLTLHMEGHPGHRGNVLAHALVAKLQRILSALGQAERKFIDHAQRHTDYEISEASKTNPTRMTLHPVGRRASYDPLPALNWTLEQISRIAEGRPTDERVDATLAGTLAEIAEKRREDDYARLWISGNGITVTLDETFKARCQVLVTHRRDVEKAPGWFEGVSYGSVVGDLLQVADIEGEHQFVIVPPAGADRIKCTFPESKRETMRDYLWKTVRVVGRLTYTAKSPFPVHVDMDDIQYVSDVDTPPHLLELRGLFKGVRRGRHDLERLLDGL
jgi:hypothetical protein